MEILFKNHHTQTKEWIKECNKVVLCRSPRFVVCHLLALLALGAGIYQLVSLHIINILFLFIPLWWFFLVIMTYFRWSRITIKRSLELKKLNSQVFSEVTDQYIKILPSDGNGTEIPYDVIKKGYFTPNYILLYSKADMLYTFRRTGFVVGNEEDFLLFLKSKGIKVR